MSTVTKYKSSSTSNEDAVKSMEEARLKVVEGEKEIQNIKSLIKNIQLSPENESSLKLSVSDLKGLPEASKTNSSYFFQLSAPVEEKKLDSFYDSSNDKATTIQFDSVDMSIATLSIRLFDDLVQLGSSDALDVSQWCSFDVMEYCENKNKKQDVAASDIVKEVEVQIIGDYKCSSPSSDSCSDDVVVVEKKDQTEEEITTDDDDANKEKHESSPSTPDKNETTIPLCTLTLRVEYHPSKTDLLDELYTVLNQASKIKSGAIEELRKHAMDMSRSSANTSTTLSTAEVPSSDTAVKSGFLNKPQKKTSFFSKWYQKNYWTKIYFSINVSSSSKLLFIFWCCGVNAL